jgi:hypothetical protein
VVSWWFKSTMKHFEPLRHEGTKDHEDGLIVAAQGWGFLYYW